MKSCCEDICSRIRAVARSLRSSSHTERTYTLRRVDAFHQNDYEMPFSIDDIPCNDSEWDFCVIEDSLISVIAIIQTHMGKHSSYGTYYHSFLSERGTGTTMMYFVCRIIHIGYTARFHVEYKSLSY